MSSLLKYRDLFDDIGDVSLISMGEGTTPLVKSRRLGLELGLNNLYFKLESLNPTGSYKDRFAALAVSGQLASQAKFCLATSSGNTGLLWRHILHWLEFHVISSLSMERQPES